MLHPAPIQQPLDTTPGAVQARVRNQTWHLWYAALALAVNACASILGQVKLAGQNASIAATAVPTPELSAGLYRVSYYARITQPATTDSELTVTIGWTDDGVACAQAGAVMDGNTTDTVQTGVLMVRIDKATTITYETTRVSVGAQPMLYKLDVKVEHVPELGASA